MNTLTRSIVAGFGILLLGAEVHAQSPRDTDSTKGKPTAKASALERLVEQTVREAGVVESASALEFQISVPGEGIVLSVVPDGGIVKKGDVLLALDDSALRESLRQRQIDLQQSQAGVAQAKADLESAAAQAAVPLPAAKLKVKVAELARSRYLEEGGELKSELAKADRYVETAKQRLELAENRLKAEREEEAAKLAVAEAKAQQEDAVSAKQLLTRHTRGHQTAVLELAVLEAQIALQAAESSGLTARRAAESAVQLQEAKLAADQQRCEELERQLEHCQMRAPRDGLVVYAGVSARRGVAASLEPGATVRQGQLLLHMPELDHLHVRVRVHESRINRVRKGQTVSLRFDAFPTAIVAGKVITINLTPEPAPSWLNQAGPTYGVIVELTKPPAGLRLGMQALAEIDAAP